jgi:phosphatidylserine/phosphatidylglycerophosphate/cardiolipin synthase-like enzyme
MILCALLAGCSTNITFGGGSNSSNNGNHTCLGNCTVGAGAQDIKLFVEPEAGDKVITDAIADAHKSVWVEMYLLTERNITRALEEAAHRGLDVRVMLETHPYGGGNLTATMDQLKAAGVQTKATSPKFALTHEKGMVLDEKTAYIMTANFTLSALGGSKSAANREYGIIDTNTQDVQSVIDIFNADWNRNDVQVNDANLVVSPINSRNAFITLISSAHKTLLIEAEEMLDQSVEQELVNAAKRGVQIQVILPQAQNTNDSNKDGIMTIKQGGIQVKEDTKLYMHAKVIVADSQKAFVGSENISGASLDRNRELGLLIADTQALETLQQTFQQDWKTSQAA